MAATVLTPYSTVAVTTAAQQLVAPGPGHYNMQIFNDGAENLFISTANTVGANATSMKLPANQWTPNIVIWGPTGIWVAGDAAGSISVLLQPRGA